MTRIHEESRIEFFRRRIEEQYLKHPTGCGGSFGEILCFELHTAQDGRGRTFVQISKKWNITLSTLGRLIADHCERMEPLPSVDHRHYPNPR